MIVALSALLLLTLMFFGGRITKLVLNFGFFEAEVEFPSPTASTSFTASASVPVRPVDSSTPGSPTRVLTVPFAPLDSESGRPTVSVMILTVPPVIKTVLIEPPPPPAQAALSPEELASLTDKT